MWILDANDVGAGREEEDSTAWRPPTHPSTTHTLATTQPNEGFLLERKLLLYFNWSYSLVGRASC